MKLRQAKKIIAADCERPHEEVVLTLLWRYTGNPGKRSLVLRWAARLERRRAAIRPRSLDTAHRVIWRHSRHTLPSAHGKYSRLTLKLWREHNIERQLRRLAAELNANLID